MKIVIYTAIFGNYDVLINKQIVIPNVDYICFTDNKELKSKTWKIIYCENEFDDPNRNAKRFKILPHKYLQEYDYSIWIDGNIIVVKDVTELIKSDYQVYNHNNNPYIKEARDCIYDEAIAVIEKERDDPNIVNAQIKRYRLEKYPEHNGLAFNCVIFRKHNDKEIIFIMEKWWEEIKNGSRRDQLSFNYIAWKYNFNFTYMDGHVLKQEDFIYLGRKYFSKNARGGLRTNNKLFI